MVVAWAKRVQVDCAHLVPVRLWPEPRIMLLLRLGFPMSGCALISKDQEAWVGVSEARGQATHEGVDERMRGRSTPARHAQLCGRLLWRAGASAATETVGCSVSGMHSAHADSRRPATAAHAAVANKKNSCAHCQDHGTCDWAAAASLGPRRHRPCGASGNDLPSHSYIHPPRLSGQHVGRDQGGEGGRRPKFLQRPWAVPSCDGGGRHRRRAPTRWLGRECIDGGAGALPAGCATGSLQTASGSQAPQFAAAGWGGGGRRRVALPIAAQAAHGCQLPCKRAAS